MSTKILNEPIEDYHKNEAISNSKLSDFIDSPLRFYQRHVIRILPKEEGEHFDIGHAFHLLMEDRAKYQAAVVDSKFEAYRTNEAKAWKEEQQKAGKIILSKEQSDALSCMHGRVLKHSVVQELIAGTEAEITWRRSYGKFAIQCRTDRYKDGLIVDWKTLPSLSSFARDVHTYGYHRQACFYQEVIAACLDLPADAPRARVVFVAVEKEPPYEVQPFEIDADSLNVARGEVMMALKSLRHCFDTDQWERPQAIETVALPFWFVKQAETRLLAQQQRLELTK